MSVVEGETTTRVSTYSGLETKWSPCVLSCFVAQFDFMVVVLKHEGEAEVGDKVEAVVARESDTGGRDRLR